MRTRACREANEIWDRPERRCRRQTPIVLDPARAGDLATLDCAGSALYSFKIMVTDEQLVSAPRCPVKAPWVWLGRDHALTREWIREFTAAELDELFAARETARDIRPDELTASDFFLPILGNRLAAAERELAQGRGYILFRGLPIGDLTESEIATVYCGIGAHLGINVSQSADGDRLGHVIDRGGTDRYYTRGGELEFHMDPVDVVGLLCLRVAVEGGASRIASAMTIHNAILEERADLLDCLYRGFHNSLRGSGDRGVSARIPTFAPGASGMECYHLPITIRQAAEEEFDLSAEEREAIDFLAEVASRPEIHLDMDLQPGDIQFLNNRLILHARTDYVDRLEPHRKRHLLRLWLMMPQWPARAEAMNFRTRLDRAGGGIRPVSDT